jgi:hypothetical protein
MPTLETLRSRILTVVDEPSLDEDYVDSLIEEARQAVAENVLLPKLETSAVVTTTLDGAPIELPEDYSRNLYGCAIQNYKEQPGVLANVGALQHRYPDIEAEIINGDIAYVAARGSELLYYPVPEEATDITIRYYTAPTLLTKDSDIPEEIPSRFQRRLIVNYVASALYEDIENGIDDQKVNALKHERNYMQALAELEASLKESQSRRQPPKGVSHWL